MIGGFGAIVFVILAFGLMYLLDAVFNPENK